MSELKEIKIVVSQGMKLAVKAKSSTGHHVVVTERKSK